MAAKTKREGEPAKVGRPSGFSEETALKICTLIADGESLRTICQAEDMPGKTTVLRWLLDDDKASFRDQYARARELQAESHVDDIIEIADDGTNDWMEKKNADGTVVGWVENGEHLQRSKLRVEARKWKASKLAAKKYGDRLDLNHSGSIQTISDEQVDARLAELLGKAGITFSAGGAGEAEEPEQAS